MTEVITAAAGFLIAVLWFDLMFDVQVVRHRGAAEVPEDVLDSISAYYRRVTTTASPMGRLVALVMVALFVALVMQAVQSELARSIFRDHIVCLLGMTTVLAAQLISAI